MKIKVLEPTKGQKDWRKHTSHLLTHFHPKTSMSAIPRRKLQISKRQRTDTTDGMIGAKRADPQLPMPFTSWNTGITLWDCPKTPSSSWSLNQECMKKSRSRSQWSDPSSLTRSEAVILHGSPGWGAQAGRDCTLTLGPSLLAHSRCGRASHLVTLPCRCHMKPEINRQRTVRGLLLPVSLGPHC